MGRMRTIARAVTWLVVALVLAGAELPVVHQHGGSTAGIYNAECPLDRLAAAPGGVVCTVTSDGSVPLVAVPTPPVPRDAAPATRPALPSGSRAPPAA
jgi:hypothetical protein